MNRPKYLKSPDWSLGVIILVLVVMFISTVIAINYRYLEKERAIAYANGVEAGIVLGMEQQANKRQSWKECLLK